MEEKLNVGDEHWGTASEEEWADIFFTDGVNSSGRFFVARRKGAGDSRSQALPKKGDPDINWQETYFLNVVTNHINYTLSMEVTRRRRTRSGPETTKDWKRQKAERCVYASPTQVRMDRKEEEVTETYPIIFFAVNDFQDVLRDLIISEEGEIVCVRLLASLPELPLRLHPRLPSPGYVHDPQRKPITIFSGAVGYEVVKQQYGMESKRQLPKKKWLSTSGGKQDRPNVFLNLKGPAGKGKAQMAVSYVTPEELAARSGMGSPSNSWNNWGTTMKKWLGPASTSSASTATAYSCSLTSVLLPWNSIISDVFNPQPPSSTSPVVPSTSPTATSSSIPQTLSSSSASKIPTATNAASIASTASAPSSSHSEPSITKAISAPPSTNTATTTTTTTPTSASPPSTAPSTAKKSLFSLNSTATSPGPAALPLAWGMSSASFPVSDSNS